MADESGDHSGALAARRFKASQEAQSLEQQKSTFAVGGDRLGLLMSDVPSSGPVTLSLNQGSWIALERDAGLGRQGYRLRAPGLGRSFHDL